IHRVRRLIEVDRFGGLVDDDGIGQANIRRAASVDAFPVSRKVRAAWSNRKTNRRSGIQIVDDRVAYRRRKIGSTVGIESSSCVAEAEGSQQFSPCLTIH